MSDRATPSLARLEHTREELVRSQWTQWRGFLQATIQLIDARMLLDRPTNLFEHDPQARAAQEAAAHAQLAALDPQRRALFEQVYEQARQAGQAEAEQQRAAVAPAVRTKPLDPDTIDRQVLQTMLDDAEGRGTHAPRGRVPIEPGTWWVVEAQTFLDAPKLDAYTIAAARRTGSTFSAYAGVLGMLAVGLVALLGYLFWPASKPAFAVAGQPVLAAGTPVPVWPLRAVQLVTESTSTTLALDMSHMSGCTGLGGDGPAAGIEAGPALPLRICVRGVDLGQVSEVRVLAQGDQPLRRYGRTSAPVPDLSLSAARGVGWFGALRETLAATDVPVGARASLDAATAVQVAAVTVVGPAEDPTLPTDQMRVTVVVSATTGTLDWPTLAPTLLSARGDVLETSGTSVTPAGTALSYVLPIIDAPTDVVWRISRADGTVARWRTTITPPRDRAALLRATLQLLDCQAHVAPEDAGALVLALSVRNNGSVPLVLQSADIALTSGNQPITPSVVEGLVAPLDPGGTRTLTVRVQAVPGTPITLSLADQRRAIRR